MMNKNVVKILIIFINILLLSLGVWQIKRGQYKQHMIDLQTQTSYTNDISLQDLKNELNKPSTNINNILYKKINIQGKFLDKSFYLYRTYTGISGYWVVNPLVVNKTNTTILVAHKFITTTKKNAFLSIDDLNKINTINTNISIELNAYILPQLPRVFNLTKDNFNINNKNLIAQNISPQDYAKYYNNKEFDILNITLISTDSNLPDLKQHNMKPDKHYGYALTWLGLLLVSLYFTYALSYVR